jgi:O-antigen ligase
MKSPLVGAPDISATVESSPVQAGCAEALHPNVLVRWAFYLSVFAIPFSQLYLPDTGGQIGVLRLMQLVMAGAVLSQPRVCLRFVPNALFWFFGYIMLRMFWGLWLTPEMSAYWWPSSREFLEFLPWLWVMFNVLQFPETRQGGWWALGLGCAFCALLHVMGIGVMEVDNGLGNRSSAFGLNANELGATYAAAIVTLLGLWMGRSGTWSQRLLPLPLIALIGVAMAKTGSRTAILTLIVGALGLLVFGKSLGSRTKRAAGLLAIGVVVAVILWQIPTVMERFQEINPQNIGQHNPRARMAPVLWSIFLRSPFYGQGPDCYEFELTRVAMPYLFNQHMLIVSHNLVLLLLVETGVMGFVLFATGLGISLSAAWRARLKPRGSLPLALLISFVIVGATVDNPSHELVFWVAMAYCLAGAA